MCRDANLRKRNGDGLKKLLQKIFCQRQLPSAILAFLLSAIAFPAAAQQSAPANDPSRVQDNQGPIETLKVEVRLTNILFTVKDKRGALLPNLKKEDFDIYEDGRKQTIKNFSSESNQPLTLGILVDTSGSQQRVLPMEQEASYEFLQRVLKEKDLSFLISFDVNVELLSDYTSSARDLRSGLERLKINNAGGGGMGIPGAGQGPFPTSNPRGTLLYDAIYLAGAEKLGGEAGRKAMIIFTDGEDQGSKLKIRDAIEAAQKSNSIVYVILIADRGFYGGLYRGDSEMKKLANETGGRVIDVGNRPEKLRDAFAQIENELRNQYSMSYTPDNPRKDPGFRKIEIKTKEGYKVQARQGYYPASKN